MKSRNESVVNIHIGKAWTVINWLTIIQKSDLADKIEWEFFNVNITV